MRNKRYLLLLLLLVAFIPYLITCFYALPFADDFCFGWTASQKISFTQKFLNQYLFWNGRYTSDVLVNLHPLTTGSLLLYQLVSFISVIATPVIFFAFIRQWLSSSFYSAIAALFISLFYLCYLPNITEGVYWYIGLVNYHWGDLCFILQLTMLTILLRGDKRNTLLIIISLLLLITAIGFNEIGALIIPAFYFAMLLYLKVAGNSRPDNKYSTRVVLTHFVVAIIASAFVICSPGNFTRQSIFIDRFNFFHSCWFAMLQTIRFAGRWVVSIPAMALSFAVLVNADKIKSDTLKKVDWYMWLALIVFVVFMAAFVPYMATGILGQHRTINYVFPFFILLWIALLLSISAKYKLTEERIPENSGTRVLIVAIAGLVVMSASGNGRKILMDIHSGIFPIYREEFLERQLRELNEPTDPIAPLGSIPGSFQVVDAKRDSTWWVDKCMAHFYRETDIVLH